MSNDKQFTTGFRNLGQPRSAYGQDMAAHGTKWKFENGWTVSIQLGDVLYSDGVYDPEQGIMEADTAEVGIFDHDGAWVHAEGYDQVFPYLTSNQVAQLVAMAANGDRAGIIRFQEER